MTTLPATSAVAFPLADADLCVKCGLCLPHCPTYLDSRNEADSPRGRIALMQGLAVSAIPQTAKLEMHLDGCLSCRACEAVCPAQVPFGRLIDSSRALLAERRPARTRGLAWLSALLTHRSSRRMLGVLLECYQRSGMQALLRRARLLGRGRLARLESLLPEFVNLPHRSPGTDVPAESTDRVQLFTGCVGEIAERAVIADAAQLFAACGYTLEIPAAQTCCGALDQHGGRATAARRLAALNLQAFPTSTAHDTPIAALASGCGASLLDYALMLGSAEARAFTARVRDPSRLLLERAERLSLEPLAARVAIHTPCTQRNVFRETQATRALLSRIPGIELHEPGELNSGQCCGAAGLHFVTHPDTADRLLGPALAAARRLNPDFIVSANIGCTLHLAAGLRRAGLKVPVLHPLSLLARQLARPPRH